MEISIIHPSKGRPEMAVKTAKKWLDSIRGDKSKIEYIFSLDIDDVGMFDNYSPAIKTLDVSRIFKVITYRNYNRSAIDAINHAAKLSSGKLIVVVSDDFDCFVGWDIWLLSHLYDKEDYVVKTADTIQPFIITLPILDRKYYERFGYIYYPEYNHMYSDTEMSCVGHMLGKTINLSDAEHVFMHHHYSVGGMAKDAINEKNDATYPQGEKLFYERLSRKFDLKIEDIVNSSPV